MTRIDTHQAACLESLEQRQMLAGYTYNTTVSRAPYRFDDGVLYVRGTSGEDTLHPIISHGTLSFELRVHNRFRAGAGPVVVLTPSTSVIDANATLPRRGYFTDDAHLPKIADVKKVVIDAGLRNDVIDAQKLDIPVEIHGGDGRDTILGSHANDTLIGGPGGDEITDGTGDDLLLGGTGLDTLRSARGRDSLFGQSSNDSLISLSDEDVLDGGAGTDTAEFRAAESIVNVERFSHFKPADDARVWGHSLRLRKDTLGVLWLDTRVTLSDSGWAVDWDVTRQSNGRFDISARFFRGGFGRMALTDFGETFRVNDLGRNGALRVTLRAPSGNIADHTFRVGSGFTSRTIEVGDQGFRVIRLPG